LADDTADPRNAPRPPTSLHGAARAQFSLCGRVPLLSARGAEHETEPPILREAEHEFEAATGRTALNAAARKLTQAKTELKRLEAEARLD
jgi:hypothetical protein